MTGIYVRVQRGDAWLTLEIEQLSDLELADFAASQPVEQGWPWACALAAWIREHVCDAVEDTP